MAEYKKKSNKIIGIDRVKVAIRGSDENTALPDRDAAIDRVTAGISSPLTIDLRVIDPPLSALDCIDRVNASKISWKIQRAIHHDGRCLQPASAPELIFPRKSQLRDVRCVDLPEH